jgi:hypothetical protein
VVWPPDGEHPTASRGYVAPMWLLFLLACSPSDSSGDNEKNDTAAVQPQERLPDLPPPACLDHAYLPLDGMGELVAAQHAPELSLTAAELEDMLEILGYPELGPILYDLDTWKVRYATQDRGQPAEATGIVVLPRLSGDLPMLMWLHHTVGAADLCAPSATGVFGVGLSLVWAGTLGVAVVAPDYLGLDGLGEPSDQMHPYVIPEPTAISSLDMARAAMALAEREGTEVRPDPNQVLLWGASQGGHAALWTDRYAAGYAPELSILGVVAAVPPTNIPALLDRGVTEWTPTSETVAALCASTADYYGLDLSEALGDLAGPVLDEMQTTCNALDPAGEVDVLEDLFTDEFRAGAGDWKGALPDWGCAFHDNAIAESAIERNSDAPMLMVLGAIDDLAWSPPAREDAGALCEQGYPLELVECVGLDHEDAAFATLEMQRAWLVDRIAGVPTGEACVLPPAEDCGY